MMVSKYIDFILINEIFNNAGRQKNVQIASGEMCPSYLISVNVM